METPHKVGVMVGVRAARHRVRAERLRAVHLQREMVAPALIEAPEVTQAIGGGQLCPRGKTGKRVLVVHRGAGKARRRRAWMM